MGAEIEKRNGVRSHIQIPKFVIKNFTDPQGKVYYYDFQKGYIRHGYPKSINTECGYYSPEMEKALCQLVESRFSKVLRKTEKISKGEPIAFTPEEQDTAFLYFYSLVARGTAVAKIILSNCITSCLLDDQGFHDFTVESVIHVLCANNFFADAVVTVGLNTTSVPFVLPGSGYYASNGAVIMPLTPYFAILLVYEKQERFWDGKQCLVALFDTPDTIRNANIRAFSIELENRRFVAANTREQLEEIMCRLHIRDNDECAIKGVAMKIQKSRKIRL